MSIIYGEDSYGLILSTGNTSSVPSGEIVYLAGSMAKGKESFGQKISEMMGGSSYSDRSGKRGPNITLPECWVVKWSTYTPTACFNIVHQFLKAKHKVGSTPIYIWIKNFTDDDYVAIGMSLNGATPYDYMKGFVLSYDWDIAEGNLYTIRNLTFKECLV